MGFNGLKPEDLNQAPIFARPRLTIGLPWRTALTLAYLPPIRVFGVKPHLFAFALERPLYERGPWTLGLRLYGQVGQLKGAFTCPKDVAKFPPSTPQNPFGCNKKSHDSVTQQYGGVEFSGSYRFEHYVPGLTPYIAVAGNFLDNKMQVKARTFGNRDRNRLFAQTWTFSATAGVIYPLTDRIFLNMSLFYTPLWIRRPPATDSENGALFNIRAGISYRWG
ncbi:MAG: transporter [Deltaproteobacteria bacterium]|nr:transporter [Deltaproteobacteria bacterium]